ncbi:MAG: DUF5011 domain-containing protein [bacterium]|nr:DUF5011 domain-containing protein [bacterium]
MQNKIRVYIAIIISISILLGIESNVLYAETGTSDTISTISTTDSATTNTTTSTSGTSGTTDTSNSGSGTTSTSDITTSNLNTTSTITSDSDTTSATGTAGTTDTTTSSINSTSWGVSLADTMPPVIKLIGETVVYVKVGALYTDLGAVAYDNADGDITSHIEHESTVNTAFSGAYHVVYEVRDRAGNMAKVARKVYVVTPPSSVSLPTTTTTNTSNTASPIKPTAGTSTDPLKIETTRNTSIIATTTSTATKSNDSFILERYRLLQILQERNIQRVEESGNRETENKTLPSEISHATSTQSTSTPILELRERVVEKIQKVVERATINHEEIQIDSDHDGISDFDEYHIYGTDPGVVDSDEDGYSDRAEITTGFDPKNPDLHAIIIYENPKDSGEVKNNILSVAEIVVAEKQIENENNTAQRVEFKGRGLPNSFVTIYIFSTPTVVTIKTDSDGNWKYVLDKELDDGNHEVYVAMTDNAGKILAKSNAIPFVKEASAITVDQNLLTPITSGESPSLLRGKYLYAVVVSIIFLIGIVFVVIGIRFQPQYRRDNNSDSVDRTGDGNN